MVWIEPRVLIQLADGTLSSKRREDLLDTDMRVFDGPFAFRDIEKATKEFLREIKLAGGMIAWRHKTAFKMSNRPHKSCPRGLADDKNSLRKRSHRSTMVLGSRP